MRLVFLCASLEPGRDGVGDYTRRLAAELAARGHDVACVAMNDRHARALGNACLRAGPEPATIPIPVLRLPTSAPWRERMRLLQEFLDERRPDWVSLQFVPYGFHHKGLPFGLPGRLARLKGNFRWHLMFHELWIGEEDHFPLRHRLIGRLQRLIAGRLGRTPGAVLHTSNPCFRDRLLSLGCHAGILPLFSNIPVVPPDPGLRRRILMEAGCLTEGTGEDQAWILSFFGAIHPQWEPGPLLERIRSAMSPAGKKTCLFLSLGRTGEAGAAVWHRLAASSDPSFRFLQRGPLPEEEISRHLHIADFGIVTSSLHLLGKSGSAAAIRSHGVPLIGTRLEESMGMELPPDVILPDGNFRNRLTEQCKQENLPTAESVAERLEAALLESPVPPGTEAAQNP